MRVDFLNCRQVGLTLVEQPKIFNLIFAQILPDLTHQLIKLLGLTVLLPLQIGISLFKYLHPDILPESPQQNNVVFHQIEFQHKHLMHLEQIRNRFYQLNSIPQKINLILFPSQHLFLLPQFLRPRMQPTHMHRRILLSVLGDLRFARGGVDTDQLYPFAVYHL